jgi:hypothetical protein
MLEAASWPVREAFAPDPGVWRATGCGSAGVIRAGPDGRVAAAIVDLQLIHGGLVVAAGDVMTAPQADEFLGLSRHLPPRTAASGEEAAAYAWGAWAFALDLDLEFNQASPVLRLFGAPRPPAEARKALLERTGERLLEIVRRNFNPDLIGGRQEPMVMVEMALRGAARAETMRKLRAQEEFGEGELDGVFGWTREYPKDHWSPLAKLGGKQVIGDVRVADDGIIRAAAQSLSMAARLAARLKELIGEQLVVAETEWRDLQDLRNDPKDFPDGDLEDENPYEGDDEPPEDAILEQAVVEQPGRNDRCWCGSGKKYKKCHLREDESR